MTLKNSASPGPEALSNIPGLPCYPAFSRPDNMGGLLYTITDVPELGAWMRDKARAPGPLLPAVLPCPRQIR